MDETDAPTMVTDGGATPDLRSGVDTRISRDVRAPDTGPVEVPLAACGATSPGEFDLWIGGLGNCSYPVEMLPMFTAAVDRDLYAAGAACGSCLEVSSPRGKVIAVVVDQYPVPPSTRGNKISLGAAALARVAAPGTSIVGLPWRWVPCPTVASIRATLKDGSNAFYWEVMLLESTNRVVKVESVTRTDRVWRPTTQEAYGFFRRVSANGLPLQLRLTDSAGNVITTGELAWGNPVTTPIALGVQFRPTCAP